MPEENVTTLEERIARSTDPNFRGRLVSQGLARSMIWSGGVLPEGSPSFSPLLTSDLLSYGYALLGQAIRLREAGGQETPQRRAFERAAEAIESVVRNGDPESPARGFHRIVAAAAYHLAHFSARSYSLVPSLLGELNLSPAEHAFALLLRRRLDDLRQFTRSWLDDPKHTDNALAARLDGVDSNAAREEVLQLALNTVFQRAMAFFEYAIRTGENSLMLQVRDLLQEGEEVAQDMGVSSLWWIFVLARHLTDDLWDHSLHVRLPVGPNDDTAAAEWQRLRRAFIALLVCRSSAEVELWPSQIEAAARALDVTDNLVVSLPTSAGKTRIAELCILRALALGGRVVFVTPLRALSAQTERTLRRTFGNLGFSVSSLYGANGAGPADADALRSRNIVVSTPEKLDFALRSAPHLIDDVSLIVLDEGHMLGLGEREIRYEILIQALLRRPDAASRRIVCLSALLPEGPDLNNFVAWLRRDVPGEPINCNWRPTRRRFGEVLWLGDRARFDARVGAQETFIQPFFIQTPARGKRRTPFPRDRTELTLATAWRLFDDGKTVLIYCPERRSVDSLARHILEAVQDGYLRSLWLGRPEDLNEALRIGDEWLGTDHPAVKCLQVGVAVHHGKLPRPFQRAVETLLQRQLLPVTIASPTLAQGLNLSAHTLLFHSLVRYGSPIKSAEFANVAGRAGRAFVDLEGQVLSAFYGDEKPWIRQSWNVLIQEIKEQHLSSGLTTLVLALAQRMVERHRTDLASFLEYVSNNASVWEAPLAPHGHTLKEREEQAFLKAWPAHVASLDCAILSLLSEEDEEYTEEDLARRLDAVLASSLWDRTLRGCNPTQQVLAKAVLVGRSRLLWRQSTRQQRRGFFFAGVGLETGQRLDAISGHLLPLLRVADQAVWTADSEAAVAALVVLARLIFAIPPFSPKDCPDNWEFILTGWIKGESVTVLRGIVEAGDFIEASLVYRLVWALEAVRVRAVAHEEWELNEADGAAAAAVETGTHCVPCALLIQNGLSSRVAAFAAVEVGSARFHDLAGMRAWLQSTTIQQATARTDWPTPETADLWKNFVREQTIPTTENWRENTSDAEVRWTADRPVPPGSPIRLLPEANGEQGVYTVDFQRLGTLARNLPLFLRGITQAWMGVDVGNVRTHSIGSTHQR